MQQLITIETVPISIEYVEKKPLKTSSMGSTKLQVAREDHSVSIKSDPIAFKMDSFKAGNTLNLSNLTYTATAQYSRDGMLRLNLHMDGDLAESFPFSQVSRNIDSMVEAISKNSMDIFAQMPGMNINFDMSKLAGGMPSVNNLDTNFMPPDLEMKVLERPKVIIKYVGGPIYIPRSSDPNYTPLEETFPSVNIKTLDAKA